jgi:ubiquinone/menaquinone biosynthesis C-methylase UbiE
MDRLANTDELLDGRLDDPVTLMGNLRDLRRFNRVLGGIGLSRDAIDRLLAVAPAHFDARPIRVLDVGTGGADIPLALLADARRRGRDLEIVATESRPEILSAAIAARPIIARVPDLALELSDGRSLPHLDRSFDVAHCSMVVHHLEPDDAVRLLEEMARVSRLGIVVNDLSRGRLSWLGAKLLTTTVMRNRFTRNDAPLSVLRAYTRSEMRHLLRRADLRPIAEIGGFVGHRYAIAAIRA